MKRDEAVTYLKEITNTCENLSPQAITLNSSKPDDTLSLGYQLHIKTDLDVLSKRQIQIIVEKYDLALTEERGKIIIYRPKKA